MQLAPYLGMLCQKAAEGSDPSLYADLILDSLPFETIEELSKLQPDPLSALTAIHPPMAAHREWFTELINLVLQTALGDAPVDVGDGSVAQYGNVPAGPTDATSPTTPAVPAGDSLG